MIRKITTLIIILLISIAGFSQVTSDPAYPLGTEAVTILFDATDTPLEGYSGDVYTHTGVIVNDNPDWAHVVGSWNNNNTQPILTRTGTDTYELEITPDIRTFYDVDADEIVQKMMFVFRGSSGSPQTADLEIVVFTDELSILISEPAGESVLVSLDEELHVVAGSPNASVLELWLDGTKVHESASSPIEYTFDISIFAQTWEEHVVIAKGISGDMTATDTLTIVVVDDPVVEEMPAGYVEGLNVLSQNSVALVLYAPGKESVFAVGDFTDWNLSVDGAMKVTPSGEFFWIVIEGLDPLEQYGYQYDVDGELRIADPYSELILDPWNDKYISEETFPNLKPYPEGKTNHVLSVFQIEEEEYQWQVEDFQRPEPKDLIVYELLIRDFTEDRNLNGVIEHFDYLKNLGVNAIELLPVNEFEGNISWGYNPSFYFALDKYYGTKNKLKEFVDLCHQNGIAVILDMVLNHQFGQSSMARLYWDESGNIPAADNPWFNQYPTHDFNVGYDMNHESPQTKAFSKRVMQFWLEEYNIDGYRFDLSKGFTQTNTLGNTNLWGEYDASRIAIWNEYKEFIHSVSDDAYIILEHFADNNEERELSNNDMMLWGNMNHNYCEASMGWLNSGSTFDWIDYQDRGWSNPHVVGYMESHDEERVIFKCVTYGNSNGSYNIKDSTLALERMKLSATFFVPIAGPKMIWMFGEVGYDYSIDFNGRTGIKPTRWDYYDDWRRRYVYNLYSALINLKLEYKHIFNQPDYDLQVSGAIRSIKVNHSEMDVFISGNFGLQSESSTLDFQNTGWWYDYITGDSVNVESIPYNMTLEAGDYHLYTDVKIASPLVQGIEGDLHNNGIGLSIFPNPAAEKINLELFLDDQKVVEISITDIQGKRINLVPAQILPAGAHVMTWSIDSLALSSGLHFVVVKGENHVLTKKFVIR